jgi:hypothetical protein
MISTRSVELVIDTVVCLTLAKWETVSGQFGGYLNLSNEEINACCAAGDLIATPYRPQPHPSAIVLYAATAGKMVLAANSGWLAYMVPKFSLGRLCDPQDPEVFAEALDLALPEAKAYKLSAAAKRLVEFHRSENFVLEWRRELSRIMGKLEGASPRDWNWVLNG